MKKIKLSIARDNNKGIREIEGYEVTYAKDGFVCVMCVNKSERNSWVLTEVKSGLNMPIIGETRKEAIRDSFLFLDGYIEAKGIDSLIGVINEGINRRNKNRIYQKESNRK